MAAEFMSLFNLYLDKSEVFNIILHNEDNSTFKDKSNIFDRIRREINRNCKENNIKDAIFGCLLKTGSQYYIRIALYSAVNDKIVIERKAVIQNIKAIDYHAYNFTIEFASEINSIEGTRLFFASAIIPGLGQLIMKKYIRGAFFTGAFCYFVYKNFSIEEARYVKFRRFTRTLCGVDDYFYTIDGIAYSYNTWISKYSEYIQKKEAAELYNSKLQNRK